MLSRIAESMFWIGRYVERAEDTARILDVQTQLLLEDTSGVGGDHLPQPAGHHGRRVRPRRPRSTPGWCSSSWPTTPRAPASVAAALAAARESARRARETLSVAMWEALNTTHRSVVTGPVPRGRARRPASAGCATGPR